MSTLHCNHRMNLPSHCTDNDYLRIDIFMQLAICRIRTHKLLKLSTCIFYVIYIWLHLLRCTAYTCSGVAFACIYVYTDVTLMQ